MRTFLFKRPISNRKYIIMICFCIVMIYLSTHSSEVNAAANGRPGTPSISLECGSSVNGGDYTIVMNMWWGNNGSIWRLYENEILLCSLPTCDNSPNMQKAIKKFSNKLNGIYKYRCELINGYGASVSSEILVSVVDDITTSKTQPLSNLDLQNNNMQSSKDITNSSQQNLKNLDNIKARSKKKSSVNWIHFLFDIWL